MSMFGYQINKDQFEVFPHSHYLQPPHKVHVVSLFLFVEVFLPLLSIF